MDEQGKGLTEGQVDLFEGERVPTQVEKAAPEEQPGEPVAQPSEVQPATTEETPKIGQEVYLAMMAAVAGGDRDRAYELVDQYPQLITSLRPSWIGPYKAGFHKKNGPHWNK